MKILYICSEFYAGMMPFGANIVNAMEESEHEIFAIFVSSPQCNYKKVVLNPESKKFVFINSPMRKLGRGFFRLFAFPLIKEIKKICKENKIDIIHLLTEDGALAFHLKFLLKTAKVYYTVHDLKPHESKQNNILKKTVNYLLGEKRVKYLRDNIDNLVTCSEFQYRDMIKIYKNKKNYLHNFPSLVTSTINNGTKIIPELEGINDYILFFGRIELYKGIHILYDEYIKNESLYGKQLVIAGNGSIYFQREKTESNIIFINRYIDDEELNDLFRNAYCVIYPYISATQSGVLSLAHHYKKPVIVSEIPFFKESITNNKDCFFDPNKTGSLLKAFTKIDGLKREQINYYDYKKLRSQLEMSYLGISVDQTNNR